MPRMGLVMVGLVALAGSADEDTALSRAREITARWQGGRAWSGSGVWNDGSAAAC